ncbi:hypothetical protein BDV97DRAFT_358107 [Delphinella strobiligena]|nr:hypothetical protein BDV97DRAFT_358107 [Delphinella strobiligena]
MDNIQGTDLEPAGAGGSPLRHAFVCGCGGGGGGVCGSGVSLLILSLSGFSSSLLVLFLLGLFCVQTCCLPLPFLSPLPVRLLLLSVILSHAFGQTSSACLPSSCLAFAALFGLFC